jgi:chromosome segregation ATPase
MTTETKVRALANRVADLEMQLQAAQSKRAAATAHLHELETSQKEAASRVQELQYANTKLRQELSSSKVGVHKA